MTRPWSITTSEKAPSKVGRASNMAFSSPRSSERSSSIRRTVEVAIDIDGLPAGSTEITVDGLSAAQRVLPVPATPGSVVTARLVGADDALALDDRADLVVGGGADRGVAVVGAGSPFLTALLQS